MPIELTWLISDKVILQSYTGDVTIEEIKSTTYGSNRAIKSLSKGAHP